MDIVTKALRRAGAMLFFIITLAMWFFGIPVLLMPVMTHDDSLLGSVCFILMIGWVFFAVSLSIDRRAADKMMKIMMWIEGEG
jgi:hypothetical protein